MGGIDLKISEQAKTIALCWPERIQEDFATRYLGPHAVLAPDDEPYLTEAGLAELRRFVL